MANRNAEAERLLASRGYTVISPDRRDEALTELANTIKNIRKIGHAQAEWIDLLPNIEVVLCDTFGIPRGTLRDYVTLNEE